MTNQEHIDWLVSVCKLGGTITTDRVDFRDTANDYVPAGQPLSLLNDQIMVPKGKLGFYCGRSVYFIQPGGLIHFRLFDGVSQ